MRRPPIPGSGSDSYHQLYVRPVRGQVSAAGMWSRKSHRRSIGPASNTNTRVEGSALRRFANTQPAEPPPTMMTSQGLSVLETRSDKAPLS